MFGLKCWSRTCLRQLQAEVKTVPHGTHIRPVSVLATLAATNLLRDVPEKVELQQKKFQVSLNLTGYLPVFWTKL